MTGGNRWRRYEISAASSAYPWSRFRAIGMLTNRLENVMTDKANNPS
jgi:hypothetical protein